MNESAKLELDSIIKTLKGRIRTPGSWTAEGKRLAQSTNEQELRNEVLALNVLVNGQEAMVSDIGKTLVGQNYLTRSLTSRGWQFWKQPLFVGQERKTVEDACTRWMQTSTEKLESLRKNFKLIPGDTNNLIEFLCSYLEINSACNQQFADDIKAVLDSS